MTTVTALILRRSPDARTTAASLSPASGLRTAADVSPDVALETTLASTLETTLASLRAQSRRPDRILWIDVADSDRLTPAAAPKHAPPQDPHLTKGEGELELFPSTPGESPVDTLNRALEACSTDLLAVLEAGVRLDPAWLEHLVTGMGPDVGAARGREVRSGAVYLAGRWISAHGQGLVGDHSDDKGAVQGAQALYRVSALRQAGGFQAWAGGQIEPGPQLETAGFHVTQVAAAVAFRTSPERLLEALEERWFRSAPARWALQQTGDAATLLGASLQLNVRFTARAVNQSLHTRRFHLLYPSMLYGLWAILRDVETLPAFSEHRQPLREAIVAAWLSPALTGGKDDVAVAATYLEDLAGHLPGLTLESLRSQLEPSGTGLSASASQLEPFRALLDELYEASSGLYKLTCEASLVGPKMITASAARDRFEQASRGLITERGFRVLMANPPWKTANGRLGVRAGSRWPFTQNAHRAGVDIPVYCPFPFFLAYTAAYLKSRGMASLLVDCIAEGLSDEEFLALAEGYRPGLVVMETSTASIDLDLQYARLLKESMPESRICLAGSHASICGRDLLAANDFVDFTLNGELEVGSALLSEALRDGTDFKHIKGLGYRAEGRIVDQGKCEAPEFEKLPWPERQMLPMYNYDDRPVRAMEWPCLQLTATRGCPYKCTFCLWPQVIFNGTSVRYRVRDPEDVAAEIRWAVDLWGFKSFYLDDDTFNIGKRRMLKLAEALKAQSLHRTHWMGMARTDHSDRETLAALKEAGMVAIKFGVESGVQSMVEHIEKDLDLATVEVAVRDCQALGIQVHLTYSVGLPGETLSTIRQNFEHVLTMAPDSIQLSMMTPFPGTKLYDEVQAKGQLNAHSWKDFDGMASTVTISESLSKAGLEEKHALFLNIWEKFRRREAPTLPEALSMFSGGSFSEVDAALQGRSLELPMATVEVITAARQAWPAGVTETLANVLNANQIVVINEPAGSLATSLGRKAGRKVDLIEPHAELADFVRFRALCARSSLRVRPDFDPHGYAMAVVGGLPDPRMLQRLRGVLPPNGLLLQVLPRTDELQRKAITAAESAGFRPADLVEQDGYLVVISMSPGMPASRGAAAVSG